MLVSACVVKATSGCGVRQLKKWEIITVDEFSTIYDVFRQFTASSQLPNPEDDGVDLSCHIGKEKNNGDDITLDANVSESAQLFGRFLCFKLTIEGHDTVDRNSSLNAFQIMRDAQRQLQSDSRSILPQRHDLKRPNKRFQLFNDFVDHLEQLGVGFQGETAQQTGQHFVRCVTDVLWMIDPHLSTMAERGCHLPNNFKRFRGYNDPATQKHTVKSLQRLNILDKAGDLERILDQPWFGDEKWTSVKDGVTGLADMLQKYASYLVSKLKETNKNHQSLLQVREMQNSQSVRVIQSQKIVKPVHAARYKALADHIMQSADFEVIPLQDFVPETAQDRRYYINHLQEAMPVRVVHFQVAYGNNMSTYHFLWRAPVTIDGQEIEGSSENIQSIAANLPHFHTRAMRKTFITKCSMLTPSVKPAFLRHIYKSLAGDSSACNTEAEKLTDKRVLEAFDMEDPDVIVDLREHNSGQPDKYGVFFDKTQEYLEGVVETAVDDRRYGEILHTATAISAPDLLKQVSATCPPGTPIPSEQWLRLQFSPKNPSTISALQHTGTLDVRYAVQSRQFRSAHEDDHYASAIFRYEKEFAIKYRDHVTFVCADDKHHAKVGEPGNPVAAVERGRRVITSNGIKFAVSDHDFTKFSIVPSVTMILDIPEDITGSFHRGQVYVGIKDQVFQPSSPIRHATEMMYVLEEENANKPILCLYTDGGPDHRVTYLSVKLSLMCVFLAMDLDMLVAVRTPPRSSWKNPPERIMATINMGMQAIGLERASMEKQHEAAVKSLSTLKALRGRAQDNNELKDAMIDSIEPVKVLMNGIIQRLSLKDKPFKTFQAATEDHMDELWHVLSRYGDIEVEKKQAELQRAVDNSPNLKRLLTHCTTSRHYMFCIKKCGEESCQVCRKPRLPPDVFKTLQALPDPVPDDDQHYRPFKDLYGTSTCTTEEHRPSLTKKKDEGHKVPFSPSSQTAKTVKRVVECTECRRPRVIYAAKKLSNKELENLDKILHLYQYSCGSTLQELETPNNKTPIVNALVQKVYVKANVRCVSPLEIPYFVSEVFIDLCYFCATDKDLVKKSDMYPCCQKCLLSKKESEKPYKRKKNLFASARQKIAAKKAKK